MREPVISIFSTLSAVCARARGAAISVIAISVATTNDFLANAVAGRLFFLMNASSK
jgi:hypothetical protein